MGGSVSTTSSNQIYLGLGYQDLNYYWYLPGEI